MDGTAKDFSICHLYSPPGNSDGQWGWPRKNRISWIRNSQRCLAESGCIIRRVLVFVDAVGRLFLHTELVELSLNDLHDLSILRILLGDFHVQGALLDELQVQCLLLDEVVELFVEGVVKREAVIGVV
jgi:hypothetical protein